MPSLTNGKVLLLAGIEFFPFLPLLSGQNMYSSKITLSVLSFMVSHHVRDEINNFRVSQKPRHPNKSCLLLFPELNHHTPGDSLSSEYTKPRLDLTHRYCRFPLIGIVVSRIHKQSPGMPPESLELWIWNHIDDYVALHGKKDAEDMIYVFHQLMFIKRNITSITMIYLIT